MTKLGQRIDSKNQAASQPTEQALSRLGAALASGAVSRGKVVDDFAGLGRVFVGLVGMRDAQQIEGECVAACARLGIPSDSTAYTNAFEAEKAMRWLALAIRDADNEASPFGTLAEWERVDPDTITMAWHRYSDLRDELQPEVIEIGPELRTTITAAIVKKNATLLRSFGTHILVSYLLSTEEPPPTSQESSFSTTDSAQDS